MRPLFLAALLSLCLVALPAAANSDKIVSIIHVSGNSVTTESLNRGMLHLMQKRDETRGAASTLSGAQGCGAETECLNTAAPAAGRSAAQHK